MARKDLQDFKVYVFLQNAFLGETARRFIREKLQNRQRTLVWVYNSGYVGEAGKSVEAMSDLIGIHLATDDKPARRTMIMDLSGLQPFWVEDPSAVPLARYVETQQVAAARKQQSKWTSIYIGAAQGLSDELLNRIARDAGAYVAGPPGQQINLSGNFASLHALRSGDYVLRLPPGCRKVLEAATGRVLARNTKEFTFPVIAQQTYWFLFQ